LHICAGKTILSKGLDCREVGCTSRGFGGGKGVSRVVELGEDDDDDACSGKKPPNIY